MQNNLEVYIARHGITPWNKEKRIQGQKNDIPISEEGIEQMKRLGSFLLSLRKQFIIVVSPMIRAQQSFQEINQILQIPKSDIYTLEEIREMNFGDFEGKLKPDTKNHSFYTERKNDKWGTKYPNGESYADIYERINKSILQNIVQRAKQENKSILIIGHESVNRVIPQVLFLNFENNQQAAENRQENNEIVILQNGRRSKEVF